MLSWKTDLFCYLIWIQLFVHSIASYAEYPKNKIVLVKGSGNFPVKKRQSAVVLYADFYNFRTKPVYVLVNAGKCCVYSRKGKTDCKIMKVLGSYEGEIGANQTHHMDFVYPTAYPYDLFGGCELHITSMKHNIQRHVIIFNTTIQTKVSQSYNAFLKSIRGILFGAIAQFCNSEDEDTYNNCQPVNCILKYHGMRNYFDHGQRKCVQVPNCMEDNINVTTKAYLEAKNRCKDLVIELSAHDKKELTKMHRKIVMETFDWRKTRITCIHGHETIDGYGCVCDHGWFSVPVQFSDVNPDIYVFKLCNDRKYNDNWMIIIDTALIVVSIIFGLLVVILAVLHINNRTRSTTTDSEEPSDVTNLLSPVKKPGFLTKIHNKLKPKLKVLHINKRTRSTTTDSEEPSDVTNLLSPVKKPGFLAKIHIKLKPKLKDGECRDIENASIRLMAHSGDEESVQDDELN